MGDPDPPSTSSGEANNGTVGKSSSAGSASAASAASGAGSADQLNLKVLGQDGQVIAFKIKSTTPFRKLMNAYCDRQKLLQSTIRFVFDGHRIRETDTPKSFEMEEDDTIEVFAQQSGGGTQQGRWRRSRNSRWRRRPNRETHSHELT